MTFAFPKKQHLAQREAITALASRGKVLFKYPIKAFCLPTGRGTATDGAGAAATESAVGITPDCSRYVFTVSKKLFKRAVKRNLLKRRMREAVRLNQEAILGGFCADFLLVYIGRDVCPYEAIETAVKDILAKGKEMAEEHGLPAKGATKDFPASGKQMAGEQRGPAKEVTKDITAGGKLMTEGKGKPAKTEPRP